MQKISAAIITFNEEKNISRCIESLLQIADEIIVVDSLSTDNTKNICSKYPIKFIEQPFLGYIEQKNFAVALTYFDYVLSLDADEALDETLQQSILAIKQKKVVADSYKMNRCTNFCGKWIKHGTWYPDKKIRLFNKHNAKWAGTNPHDFVEIDKQSSCIYIKGDILHYSYNSLEEVITQANKFTTIQANAMYKKGKRASVINLIVNPCVAFISGYFIKLGFLDGKDGFILAKTIAYQTLLKYAKLLHLQKANKHNNI
ncbi:MAG TPA: glycosyltransferase family 2 protein [Chitinophagaceae bacterium]|nr:glycosyltransferase family 2 protein [Chitinophagaceae bacterium]MCC6634214.1 glycosyltransferase family 2 protein [Chitinophagaceae bacterium]HMZ45288.1 glycosyltransferase family 2 protein [Chitinophagaceae bacterium]HNE93914.1 glycosyltransferase family 2 protein [Chitinophagaceae bacterium]HNF30138.1 glycosyltransferase family 2 protein [Chitinophagaceae bacterium]